MLDAVERAAIRPCIGCGFCCKQAPCTLGLREHPRARGECPALRRVDGKYRCGLVLDGRVVPEDLFIGEGCGSPLNSDRSDMEAARGTTP